MSKKTQPKLVQDALRRMFERVSAAQGLLEQDGDCCIDLLKLLAEASQAGSLGIVAMIGPCLEEKLDVIQTGPGDSAVEEIDQLIKLADFSLLNLCLSCRKEVGRSLMQMRPDNTAATSPATPEADSERKIVLKPIGGIGV